MKTTLSYIGAVVSFGFLIASGVINYNFGTRLAEAEWLKHIMGGVAVMAVAYNAICPFLVRWWKSYTGKALALLLWFLCLAYTATSAVGFAAENRTLVQSQQLATNSNLSIYHDMLNDELAKKYKNSRKIEELRLKIISMNDTGAAKPPDPQAKMLAAMMWQTENTARIALVVLFALLIEVGATLGLYASLEHLNQTPRFNWKGEPIK